MAIVLHDLPKLSCNIRSHDEREVDHKKTYTENAHSLKQTLVREAENKVCIVRTEFLKQGFFYKLLIF